MSSLPSTAPCHTQIRPDFQLSGTVNVLLEEGGASHLQNMRTIHQENNSKNLPSRDIWYGCSHIEIREDGGPGHVNQHRVYLGL